MHPQGPDPLVIEAIEKRGNAVVFLDVAVGDDDPNATGGGSTAVLQGRIQLELFMQDCPKVRTTYM
jgi:hypothetical protein